VDKWAHIKNVSGLDLYVNFHEHLIFEITSYKPERVNFAPLPERFLYIENFLKDHTKQPIIIEALADFDLSWTTPFQMAVYKALALIPCGTTVTYGELAKLAGSPNAARAIGSTMSKNRFLIALPCHRVVASGGKLGGFSSGIDNKIRLLKTEGINDF